jgi:GNAT superfamily N-acetyltransferase
MKDLRFIAMEQFRDLFGKNPNRSTGREYYEWKIGHNPYGAGTIYLEKRDDKIIGSATLTPKPFLVHGKSVRTVEIGDTFTHPEYRRQGVFTICAGSCVEYALHNGIQVIYGTPNSNSLPGYEKKLGFSQLQKVQLRCFTKVYRFFPILMKCFIKVCLIRNLNNQKALLKRLCRQWFTSRPIRFKQHTYKIVELKELPDQVDGLWGDCRFAFYVVRDSNYLNWRYFQNPDAYTVFAAIEQKKYRGYLILKYSSDDRTATICDFITHNDDPEIFKDLLEQAEACIKSKKVSYAQVYCPRYSPYAEVLKQYGYLDDSSKRDKPIIIYTGTQAGKELLKEYNKTHFTLSDCDNI